MMNNIKSVDVARAKFYLTTSSDFIMFITVKLKQKIQVKLLVPYELLQWHDIGGLVVRILYLYY